MKFKLLINVPTYRLSATNYAETNLIEPSLDGTMTMGGTIDSLSFELDDPDNSLVLHEGYDVTLEELDRPSNRFFGGIVQSIQYMQSGLGRRIRVSCQDWTALLDKMTIRKKYEKAGQTGQSIIKDVFLVAVQQEGQPADEFDTSEFVQADRTVAALNFQGTSLTSIIRQIADITGYVWFVDPFKKLHYHPPTFGVGAQYSDVPDNITTFPLYDLTVSKDLADWNTIELVGGKGVSDDVTETYAGDATSKIFVTGVQANTNQIHLGKKDDEEGLPFIERNTGSQGSPTWTTQTIKLESEPGAVLGTTADVLWNPFQHKLTFHVAPLNGSNGFRITGRYFVPVMVINRDTRSVDKHNRVFKASMTVPEATDVEQAYDLAMAYLREHSDRIRFSFTTNADTETIPERQIMPCDVIFITNTAFNLTEEVCLVEKVSFNIVGGETLAYRVSGKVINASLYRNLEGT